MPPPRLIARSFAVVMAAFAFAACADSQAQTRREVPPLRGEQRTAIFAGGCFWSIEHGFEQIPGVIEAESGFTGGHVVNPSYRQGGAGGAGHGGAGRRTYDFRPGAHRGLGGPVLRLIDPTDPDGQFCDQGPSYVSGVYATPAQRPVAEASRRAAVAVLGHSRVRTPVLDAHRFWRSESYHQNNARPLPANYQAYATGCRRAARLRAVWG